MNNEMYMSEQDKKFTDGLKQMSDSALDTMLESNISRFQLKTKEVVLKGRVAEKAKDRYLQLKKEYEKDKDVVQKAYGQQHQLNAEMEMIMGEQARRSEQ